MGNSYGSPDTLWTGTVGFDLDVEPTLLAEKVTAAVRLGGKDTDSGEEVSQARIVITDNRSEESSTQERDMKCLFEECGMIIDERLPEPLSVSMA